MIKVEEEQSLINSKINKRAGALFIHFIIVSSKPSTESSPHRRSAGRVNSGRQPLAVQCLEQIW